MSDLFAVPALSLPVDAELSLPGSKSHANRAIACACLARGTTRIRGATLCDDVQAMVSGLQAIGFKIRWEDEACGILRIDGGIPAVPKSATIDCHNAGTALRFLTSIAAITPGHWILTGDAHMQKRPIADLVSALRSLGVEVSDSGGCPPLTIRGESIRENAVRLKAQVSSQFLTSLLLIAPVLPQGLSIELDGDLTSSGYIDLTIKTISDFGINVVKKSNTFIVQHGDYRPLSSYDIEGDWSAAGAWLVLNALTGSTVRMSNLQNTSSQSDRLLPAALVAVGRKGDVTFDCSQIPDQVMNLCVFAGCRTGTVTLTGIANLRKKECDRLHVITTELRKAGIEISEQGDDLIVNGLGSVEKLMSVSKAVTLDPHQDHRMAMAFAILGLLRGNVSIQDSSCVRKSYPNFFEDLRDLTNSGKTVSIVGMRGVGKSSMGKRLASKLSMDHEDSDHLFEDRHGSIREFVKKHGWDAFRRKEEEVIATALRAGVVLSLGGGALGSKKTRALIREKTIAVWLQAKEGELIKRLCSGKRPPLTDLPLKEEVRKFLLERGPHYREVAKICVSPTVRFREQIPYVLRMLRASLDPVSFTPSR